MKEGERHKLLIACILIVGLILFLCPKTPSKDDVKSQLLSVKYDAKITEIRVDHQVYVKGTDKQGEVSYSIYNAWPIIPYIALGDSLKKDSGDLNIRIVKNDTVIILEAQL